MEEKLAVLGAGLMGHSIALAAAWSGMPVVLRGIDEENIRQAQEAIRQKLRLLQEHDLLGTDHPDDVYGRIRFVPSVEEAVADATFVIEAIPEDLQLKQSFFRHLDEICGANAVLASNTSGLSPTAIAAEMRLPERMVVTHFWNPAHLIPLVEVVRGEKTNDETVQRALRLLRNMKKRPIEVKKDIPGFVGNRLQYALFREAQYILEQGAATVEDIDMAVRYSIARRLPVTGPFMTADMGGLDVFDAISNYLFADLSDAKGSLATMRSLVENGHFGQKSGRGFYEWPKEFAERMNRLRERELIRFLKEDAENERSGGQSG